MLIIHFAILKHEIEAILFCTRGLNFEMFCVRMLYYYYHFFFFF